MSIKAEDIANRASQRSLIVEEGEQERLTIREFFTGTNETIKTVGDLFLESKRLDHEEAAAKREFVLSLLQLDPTGKLAEKYGEVNRSLVFEAARRASEQTVSALGEALRD